MRTAHGALLAELPDGPAFDLLAARLTLEDVFAGGFPLTSRLKDADLRRLVRGTSWQDASTLVARCACPEFLAWMWATDSRHRVRAAVLANEATPLDVLVDACADPRPFTRDALLDQPSLRLLDLMRNSPSAKTLMGPLTDLPYFAVRLRNELVEIPVDRWPACIGTDDLGDTALSLAIATFEEPDVEALLELASTWPVSGQSYPRPVPMALSLVLRDLPDTEYAALVSDLRWPELALAAVETGPSRLSARLLLDVATPLGADEVVRLTETMISQGTMMDATLARYVLDHPQVRLPYRNVFSEVLVSTEAIDVIADAEPATVGTSGPAPASRRHASDLSPYARLLDWVVESCDADDLPRVFAAKVGVDAVLAALPPFSGGGRRMSSLPPTEVAALCRQVPDAVGFAMLSAASVHWTSAQWESVSPELTGLAARQAPPSFFTTMAARMMLTWTAEETEVVVARAEADPWALASAASSLPHWSEAAPSVELARRMLSALDSISSRMEEGLHGSPRNTPESLLYRAADIVGIHWMQECTPSLVRTLTLMLSSAQSGWHFSGGPTYEALVASVRVPMGQVAGLAFWRFAGPYLAAAMGDDPDAWETLSAMLPGWEGSLDELVAACRVL